MSDIYVTAAGDVTRYGQHVGWLVGLDECIIMEI